MLAGGDERPGWREEGDHVTKEMVSYGRRKICGVSLLGVAITYVRGGQSGPLTVRIPLTKLNTHTHTNTCKTVNKAPEIYRYGFLVRIFYIIIEDAAIGES